VRSPVPDREREILQNIAGELAAEVRSYEHCRPGLSKAKSCHATCPLHGHYCDNGVTGTRENRRLTRHSEHLSELCECHWNSAGELVLVCGRPIETVINPQL
jgi:hypothetical protein